MERRRSGSSSGEELALLAGPDEPGPTTRRPTLFFAWLAVLLAVATCAISSAGAVFASMPEVPPLTRASWRLQATALLLVLPAAADAIATPPADRARLLSAPVAGLVVSSGCALGLHFGFWLVGVATTTLLHSLIFVSAAPLLIALWTWARRLPISWGEAAGTLVGACGAALLAADATSAAPAPNPGSPAAPPISASLSGDAASLLGAAAMVVYLFIGAGLRQWCGGSRRREGGSGESKGGWV